MSKRNLAVLILAWFAAPTLLLAQKNEASFSVGGIFTGDQNTSTTILFHIAPCPISNPNCDKTVTSFETDSGVAFEGSYARRVAKLGPTSFYLELPLVGVPGRDVHTVSITEGVFQTSSTVSSWSLFFTPSVKLKFWESASVSPFVSVGGGLAHSAGQFVTAASGGATGISSTSTNAGALQFGGGLDFKTPIPRMVFRAQVRNFYAASLATPSNFTRVSPEHLHHVYASGGVVLRF